MAHKLKGSIYTKLVFVRKEGFYPLDVEIKVGKSQEQLAKEHAEVNNGTLRVEDCNGNILWEKK